MVKGSTRLERDRERARIRAKKQVSWFAQRVREATTGLKRLDAAVDYAKATGRSLDDRARTDLARAICRIVDEMRQGNGYGQ